MDLKNQKEFLKEYNISQEEFANTKLKWEELAKIYESYLNIKEKLESTSNYIADMIRKAPKVHSVRSRVKEPEHLIEKIIRKKVIDPSREINLDNYTDEIQDLIGIRVLHLFKEDWVMVNKYINDNWNIDQRPIANVRDGDNIDIYKDTCDINPKEFGYRSVHYILTTQPTKRNMFAEIQVRTLFEEAWSEVDHLVRYPYDQDNTLLGQYLKIFNRLAGSADEMGSFLNTLKNYINELQEFQQKEIEEQNKKIDEKDRIILDLKSQIDSMEIKQGDKDKIKMNIDKLNEKDETKKGIYNLGLNVDIPRFSIIDPDLAKKATGLSLLAENINATKFAPLLKSVNAFYSHDKNDDENN